MKKRKNGGNNATNTSNQLERSISHVRSFIRSVEPFRPFAGLQAHLRLHLLVMGGMPYALLSLAVQVFQSMTSPTLASQLLWGGVERSIVAISVRHVLCYSSCIQCFISL